MAQKFIEFSHLAVENIVRPQTLARGIGLVQHPDGLFDDTVRTKQSNSKEEEEEQEENKKKKTVMTNDDEERRRIKVDDIDEETKGKKREIYGTACSIKKYTGHAHAHAIGRHRKKL